ncbi:hypothetical protein H311_04473, partial [Anncaliia algerae PRA109]
FSQIYNFLDENILTQIIDKQSTFCTKFGYHSIYFTEFLVILSKCKRISMNLYLKIFMMLLTQMMQKEILELLCFLVNKIELHRRDYTNNFILDMDWVQALEDKVIEEETLEIKLILAARHFKFLIDNKLIYNEQTVDKIKRICSKLGISSINEFAAKSPSNLYSSEQEPKKISVNEEITRSSSTLHPIGPDYKFISKKTSNNESYKPENDVSSYNKSEPKNFYGYSFNESNSSKKNPDLIPDQKSSSLYYQTSSDIINSKSISKNIIGSYDQSISENDQYISGKDITE